MSAMGALLPDENILLDVDLVGRTGLFHAVGELFERRYALPADRVAASLDARERIGSTGLGQGVAIPHARIKGLERAIAAFVRTRVPIAFGAPDDKPVSDFLVLLVPAQATDLHLQILADVATRFDDRNFREQLRACTEAAAARALFADWVPA
jgi:PTS system nitrogen regulatory IIA component